MKEKAKKVNFIEEKLEELKKADIEVVELKHAYRLNGVVDVWKGFWGYMTFEIPVNEYKKHEDLRTSFVYAEEAVKRHEKRPAFKRLPTGNISMQEYRHNKNNLYYKAAQEAKKESK